MIQDSLSGSASIYSRKIHSKDFSNYPPVSIGKISKLEFRTTIYSTNSKVTKSQLYKIKPASWPAPHQLSRSEQLPTCAVHKEKKPANLRRAQAKERASVSSFYLRRNMENTSSDEKHKSKTTCMLNYIKKCPPAITTKLLSEDALSDSQISLRCVRGNC